MSITRWEHFFKPEVRSSGRALSLKGKISQSRPSDTELLTYFRTSGAPKVTLKSESVSSRSVLADCSCPQFKKGQFCKHLWAALLECENKESDFLLEKTDLQIKKVFGFESEKSQPKKNNASLLKRVETYKKKQTDFRRQQYQKQKQRIKDQKNSKKNNLDYPESVQRALDYFSKNGISLREAITDEAIALAKKKLSRVFHPDLGGSHDEMIELNANAEVLMKYVK